MASASAPVAAAGPLSASITRSSCFLRSSVVMRAVAAPPRPTNTKSAGVAMPELVAGTRATDEAAFLEYKQATQMIDVMKESRNELADLLAQLNVTEREAEEAASLLAPPSSSVASSPPDHAARRAKRAAIRAERKAQQTSGAATASATFATLRPSRAAAEVPSSSHASPAAPFRLPVRPSRPQPAGAATPSSAAEVDSSSTSSSSASGGQPGAHAPQKSEVQHLEELFMLTVDAPEPPSARGSPAADTSAVAAAPVLVPRKAAKKRPTVLTPSSSPVPASQPIPHSPPASPSADLRLEDARHAPVQEDVHFLDEHASGPSHDDLVALERSLSEIASLNLEEEQEEEQSSHLGSRAAAAGSPSGTSAAATLETSALAARQPGQLSAGMAAGPSILSLVPSSASTGHSARARQARRNAHMRGRTAAAPVRAAAREASPARPSAASGGYDFMSNRTNADLLDPQLEREVTTICKDFLFLEKVQRQCAKTLQRAPTVEELAKALGMDTASYTARYEAGVRAKELLLKSNYRLVTLICKKYLGRGMPLQDLMTEGIKGLLRGVEGYDHSKGFRFATYATWWVRQAVSRSMTDTGRAVRLPSHLIDSWKRVRNMQQSLAAVSGHEPSSKEVAEKLGWPVSRVEMLLEAARSASSLDTPVAGSDSGTTAKDQVEDGGACSDETFGQDTLKEDMEAMLSTLHEREAMVLRLRFGLEDGVEWTLEDIGAKLDVTRERIRQIEAKALMNLKLHTVDSSGKLRSYSESMELLHDKDVAARTSSGTRKT